MADSTAIDERACATCGVSIAHLFKLRKYCDQHTPRTNTKGMKPCPKCGKKSWASKTQCRSCAAPTINETRCQTCARRGRSRCSTCYWNAKEAEECGACGQHRKLIAKGMCASCYSTAYRAEHGRKKYYRDFECEHCGITATSSKKSTRFCSLECAKRNAAGWVHSTALVRTRPRHWIGQTIPSSGTFVGCACNWCGAGFIARNRARYCSSKCSANAQWKRRYDRKGEFYISRRTRFAIYERDRFTCQICLDPVDMSLPTQDRMGHTLDHIVPQSHQLVPDHSASNLRLAHRLCNSIRGDRVETGVA